MEHMLQFDASQALYLQLADKLRYEIEHGIYPSGSKLPTENELSETYSVSRVTVRKALALLDEEKYIEKKVGRGTYVREQKMSRHLTGNVSSFTLMCKAMGKTASARTLRVGLEEPDEENRQLMLLRAGDPMIVVERIRFADEEPLMIETDYFSPDFDFLMEEDLNHNSLYELIRRKKQVVFTGASRTIEIVFAQSREAQLLGVHPGYPLLRITSLTHDESGQNITRSVQLCIGDKFRLQV